MACLNSDLECQQIRLSGRSSTVHQSFVVHSRLRASSITSPRPEGCHEACSASVYRYIHHEVCSLCQREGEGSPAMLNSPDLLEKVVGLWRLELRIKQMGHVVSGQNYRQCSIPHYRWRLWFRWLCSDISVQQTRSEMLHEVFAWSDFWPRYPSYRHLQAVCPQGED